MKDLSFELPVGLTINGETHKNVELLKTNGVSEKIITKKLSEKPYTWQGNVISACVKSIGPIEIGADVRNKYLKDGSVTIPHSVLSLPLAEINTLMLEIHRRAWVSFIPKQEIICKYCGRKLIADIDLDKIDYSEEDKEQIAMGLPMEQIVVNLRDGFIPPVIPKITDKEEYTGITETEYNQFVFRVPLLSDALRREKYFSDSISFWRQIAMDCLVDINCVIDGEVLDTLPKAFHTWYGLKIFNEYLSAFDLREIRSEIMEFIPTLPYAYYEECPHCDNEIPMVMEVSNFFSE